MTILFIEPNSNVLNIQYTTHCPENFAETMNLYIESLIRIHTKFLIDIDLKGLNISTLVKQQEWINQVMHDLTLEQYFPNLEEVRIHNASLIAKQVMGMLSRVIQKDTFQKIKFVSKHNHQIK